MLSKNKNIFWYQVMRSINDNITEDVLFNEINEIIRLPLYADRIQRDIRAHQHMVSARRRWPVGNEGRVEGKTAKGGAGGFV